MGERVEDWRGGRDKGKDLMGKGGCEEGKEGSEGGERHNSTYIHAYYAYKG